MPLVIDDFDHARSLRGSPRRDAFKHGHKVHLGRGFYASDLDLLLVARDPPRLVAVLDCKQPGEDLSFAEVIAYNGLLAVVPVYVVYVRDPAAEVGPFTVCRYHGGDWRPRPPRVELEPLTVCADWAALGAWETRLREESR